MARALSPDVILMDLRMPVMDGLTAVTELARLGVTARVLVLTTYDTDAHVLPAIEAGATGYLNRVKSPARRLLSARELEVLGLVASGNTNREAAARLFITEATVKSHLLNVYAKLGVSDRAAAVAEAFHQGLLKPQG